MIIVKQEPDFVENDIFADTTLEAPLLGPVGKRNGMKHVCKRGLKKMSCGLFRKFA